MRVSILHKNRIMDIENLQYVIGKAEADRPAVIRFFGPVCHETVERFNDEFLWLQEQVRPSRIVVLINSEGGSVIQGMSVYSIIQACPIETHCVVEGIAASMGSVIWAAGHKRYMHDYSILMIHNPFVGGADSEDVDIRNMVGAFKKQLEVIYQKRFGMKLEAVREMMDGAGEATATYFNAKDAVDAGIITADCVIKTSKQLRDKVKNEIKDITGAESLRSVFASVIDEDKLMDQALSILEKSETEIQAHITMENEKTFLDAVIGQLGFPADSTVASVSARINELVNAQKELSDVKSKFSQLEIQFKGKEAEAQNLAEKLNDVEGKLKVYQEAEKAANAAKREQLVQSAIDAAKIAPEAKESWLALAESNFEMVKATLESIPAREKITDAIGSDAKGQQDAKDAMDSAEKAMEDKVKAVLGENFELKPYNKD